jgi:hypothetical protein
LIYSPEIMVSICIGRSQESVSLNFDVGRLDMSCFARASTLYKGKGEKVLPQNVTRTDGAPPGGEAFWKEKILEQEGKG